jgi:glutamine synthetase
MEGKSESLDTERMMQQVKKDKVEFIQLQFTDILGLVKSLTIPVQHLPDSLEHGTWFDGSSIEGFARICESDLFLSPDPSTYAVIPWLESGHGNTARFICDIYNPDGSPFAGDPRFILKKVLQEAHELGYEYNTGPELEFFLLRKDDDLISDMTKTLECFDINVEASHHEVALGQHEIDFRYGNALKTADSATTLRFVLKAIAQKHDLHATFMPKPIAGINGSGMHVHQSLFDLAAGTNAFYDDADPYRLSRAAYGFIAGQLRHIKAMCAILAPTVNSYKRLIPGYEAPVYISWGRINRSALIRVPMYSAGRYQSTRIELRCPDPSCNIYLAFAIMLKAGLDGIANELVPPDPVEEDVYHFDDARLVELSIDTLPYTLWGALKELRADPLMREVLGTHTFDRYLEAKTEEWDDYRIQVTQWELDKYLEVY